MSDTEVETGGGWMSAEEMDEKRQQNVAHEYLCRLEEAKKWIETCIKEKLPPAIELEEGLRNGVYLAKLANFFAPTVISFGKIYDLKQTRELEFRHTDNINLWLKAMKHINLPATFYPETTDLHEKKNMPKVIYCVHALSMFLFKLGLAPKMQDFNDNVNFTEEEINAVKNEIESYGIDMPAFSEIRVILAKMSGDEDEQRKAVTDIVAAIQSSRFERYETVLEALRNPVTGIQNLDANCASLYREMLMSFLNRKRQEENDEDASIITADDIQVVVENCNRIHSSAQRFCIAMSAINIAIDNESLQDLSMALQNPDAHLPKPIPACNFIYLKAFSSFQNLHALGKHKPKLIYFETKFGMCYVWDLYNSKGIWCRQNKVDMDSACLDRSEILDTMIDVNLEYDRKSLTKSLEPCVTMLQPNERSMMMGSKSRLQYLNSQTKPAIKIQSWWRGAAQRMKYQKELCELKNKIQSLVRMLLARRSSLKAQEQRKREEIAAIKIQQFWRSNQARRDFHTMMNSESPSFAVVKKFVHMLDLNNLDYSEELELHKLRWNVVQLLRHNQKLERDLNDMDIKIGLLVKNRITLQEVGAHGEKLDKKSRQSAFGGKEINCELFFLNMKSLSKNHIETIEAYQHLFYLLRTNPVYLARLMVVMAHSEAVEFIESVIYSLYNFASNPREEFLLLQLFETALQEEIRCRLNKSSDIITATPLVIKMIVSFYRNQRGQASLREVLGPLVERVLNDKTLHINLNPSEVYKSWVNEVESQSGQPMGLEYEVTNDKALEYPEVQSRIQSAIECLQKATALFSENILQSLDKIPYGMRYMARVLNLGLQDKFPETNEKDHFKYVRNFLCYQYIIPAIEAPDAFDIVDVAADNTLTSQQRGNLEWIAKILQFIAAKKEFGGESAHLMCMNDYIKTCNKKFQAFFRKACEVEDLAKHFHLDEFAEETLLVKPTIYMTFQEVIDMHLVLLEFEDEIAPNPKDIFHKMLKDLSFKPDPALFIKGDKEEPPLFKIEICLTLSNKFSVPENCDGDLDRTLVSTKQMLVDAMRFLPATSLKELLKTHPTQQEREAYKIIAAKERRSQKELECGKHAAIPMSFLLDNRDNELTLDEVLDSLKQNLGLLDKAGYVSKKDHYQGILNAISKDISNRRRYRRRRKEELSQLQSTHISLQAKRAKSAFDQEQIDFYNLSIAQCLEIFSTLEMKLKQRTSLKYSRQRLHEKGILVDVKDLRVTQSYTFSSFIPTCLRFDLPSFLKRGYFSLKNVLFGKC